MPSTSFRKRFIRLTTPMYRTPNPICRLALLACYVLSWPAIGLAQNLPTLPSADEPFKNSRELLEAMGVDDSYFRLFVEGAPLEEGEQEPLLRVLYAVRRFQVADLERWAEPAENLPEQGDAEAGQGHIYRLAGTLRQVSREEPFPEAARRFETKQYYRCQVQLDGEAGLATIFALEVPQAWRLDQPLSERVSVLGFFLKHGSEDEQDPQPVLAAQRVAWHSGLLGEHGMDVGLLELLKDKTEILAQERECFYQLLAAVGRIDTGKLLELTSRSPDDDYSVVPLFNDPAGQRGKLVALTGTARRAMLVKLDPHSHRDTIERFGFDHWYQIEIFTRDSQSNPLVFCVRELPSGMPQGPNIYETVRIPGFFLKSWAYRIDGLDDQPVEGRQLAPMLIGRQPIWIESSSGRDPVTGAIAGGAFLCVLAGLALAVWWSNRRDQKFRAQALARRLAPESNRSLNDLELEQSGEPDFRNLQE